MTSHTLDHTPPSFEELLFYKTAFALRMADGKEDTDIDLFIHQDAEPNKPIPNRVIIERLVAGWLQCTADDIHGYGRSMCYSVLDVEYSPDRFNEVAELHYQQITPHHFCMKDYWDGIASHIQNSLDKMI